MRYRIVLGYDHETRSHTATVPGLPVVVDADREEETIRLVREAITWYLEEAGASKSSRENPPVDVKIVTVDV